MREEPLQIGEGGRLFGILTLANAPASASRQPSVFVFLSAGLVHRVGPHRLHVRVARRLAELGVSSLRVDLAGIGDSPANSALTYRESVAADFADIVSALETQFVDPMIVLVGLCSGADNAVRLATREPRVTGMVLLDPYCEKDDGFRQRAVSFDARALARKIATPSKYLPWINRKISAFANQSSDAADEIDKLSMRDLPSLEETRKAFEAIRDRNGRVLSVLTQYALDYYNEAGQMRRVVDVGDYDKFSTELFLPHVEHTYPLEMHREMIIKQILSWASAGATST